MQGKRMFPLFIDLSDKQIVVIGGGHIAERRIKVLTDFTKNIKVIAPKITPVIENLSKENKISWIKKEFSEDDINGAYMVLAVTDNYDVNHRIYEACKKQNIFISNAGDVNECEFHFPGIICYDEVVIGFNGGGYSHSKTRKTRERVEGFLKGTDNQ